MRTIEQLLMNYRNHHATIFVPLGLAEPIEAVRQEWDPVMAAQIRAHITLAYPQEAPLADLLVARLRTACYHTAPFRLRLGALAYFERPEEGVYIEVQDIDRDYRRLRQHLLCPPFQPIAFPPHVTLIHPRTSARGRDFWNHGRYQPDDQEFTVAELAITAFDGMRWVVLERLALGREG
jgi:2'-5' RNA ligase